MLIRRHLRVFDYASDISFEFIKSKDPKLSKQFAFAVNIILVNNMTRDKMKFIIFFFLQYIYFDQYGVDGSWVPLNPLHMPYPPTSTAHIQRIELGNDGRRIAVGSSNNSITVYDLISVPAQSNDFLTTWEFTAHVSGVSGVHFSLSPNGQFLASRHQFNAKQVQVWEILNSDSQGGNLTTHKEGDSYLGILQSKVFRLTENVESIGTFWCVADGKSVKLGQAGSKLYLTMSCETWLSNRGKVQVFVRDLSLPGNSSSAWDTSFPSLEGRNADDLFGSALSIAEAASHHSGYEFRLAVSSPGYNNNQGLVQIYTASYTLSSGWDQMGDDLVGSHIGERFGATLDISGNINDQPFLIVGSPGWKRTADNFHLTHRDDLVGDEEILESLGTGLVRLYHWRKSASTFGAPRRWILVGKPMIGRNDGDQFGSSVMISQSGERIAIAASPIKNKYKNSFAAYHPRGYLAVYERESFYSWGKAVNDVITFAHDRFPCHQISQCLALNNRGSMIMVTLTNGTVGAYVDDMPFCSIDTTQDPQTTVDNNVSSAIVDLEALLDRQTCRKSDTLIQSRSLCLEQSFYKRGKYQACLWRSAPITLFPPTVAPMVISANPKSTDVSMLPSTSPSFPSSVPVPGNPSMLPRKSISIEPSIVPKFPTISYPQTPYSPLQAPLIKTGEPSDFGNDEIVFPSSTSILPTSIESEIPLGRSFSRKPSSSPSVVSSLSQRGTGSPVNHTTSDDTIANDEARKEPVVSGMIASALIVLFMVCGWFANRHFRISCDTLTKQELSFFPVSSSC